MTVGGIQDLEASGSSSTLPCVRLLSRPSLSSVLSALQLRLVPFLFCYTLVHSYFVLGYFGTTSLPIAKGGAASHPPIVLYLSVKR